MPNTPDQAKPLKMKKTVDELFKEGQVKTGKMLLEQAAQKIQEKEAFLAAAQDEERMRSQKGKRTR
jgi:hypothetical protein